jgi:hypothetical protein
MVQASLIMLNISSFLANTSFVGELTRRLVCFLKHWYAKAPVSHLFCGFDQTCIQGQIYRLLLFLDELELQ